MNKDMNQFNQSLASASVTFLFFLVVLAALFLVETASDKEFLNSDPLVRFFGNPATTILTLALGFVSALYWIRKFEVNQQTMKVALLWAFAGIAFSASALVAIYLVNGPVIPAFIPPEESAQSGMLLGLSAGMFEEVVLRMMVLPFLLAFLCTKFSFNIAALLSALFIGVLFTLSHELAGDPFNMRYFITRFLIPGFVMTLVFIRVHPAAMLSGHSASHILIALLFVSSE